MLVRTTLRTCAVNLSKPKAFLLLPVFLILPGSLQAESPVARQGLLDLRTVDLNEATPLRLEGEWAFYWNQLIAPQDIEHTPDFTYQDGPKDWMRYRLNGVRLPWSGAATLRLKVLLPPLTDELVLRAGPMVMAGRIFVNGRLVHEAGTPGLDREVSGHSYQTQLIFLGQDLKDMDIVIQVSNHMIARSGYAALDLGLRTPMLRSEVNGYNKTLFLLGGIFLMAIYHLCLFMMRRTEISNLYFSALCLANGLFHYAAAGVAALHFPGISSERVWDLFFWGWYLGGAFFSWFAHSVFPRHFHKNFAYGFSLLSAVSFFTVLFGTTDQFHIIPNLHKLGNTLIFLYIAYACYRAMRDQVKDALVFLIATTIFFASTVNDMLVTTGDMKGELLSSTGLFIFLFFQSILLSKRFSAAFHQLEVAETEIRALNEGLEHKVQQKTREIRAILTHIQQGIFTLRLNAKSDIVMGEDYSQYLEEILETRDLTVKLFQDVLLNRTDLSNDQKSQIRSTIIASIGED